MKKRTGIIAVLIVTMFLVFAAVAMAAPMDRDKINPQPQKVGNITLKATMIPFDPPYPSGGTFNMFGFAPNNGKYITLHNNPNDVKAWDLKGGKLVEDKTAFGGQPLVLAGMVNGLVSNPKGDMYTDYNKLSVFNLKSGLVYKGDTFDKRLKGKLYAVDPTYKWALYHNMADKKTYKVDIAKFTSGAADAVTEFDAISNLKDDAKRKIDLISMTSALITKDRIYMGGNTSPKASKDGNQHAGLAVCDLSGKQLALYTDEGMSFNKGKIGWTHGIIETKNGIATLDGNLRKIFLFDKKLQYVGEASLKVCLVSFTAGRRRSSASTPRPACS